MNFFEHQDKARTNSKRLILLFVLAVVCIVLLVNLCVFVFLQTFTNDQFRQTKSQVGQQFADNSFELFSYVLQNINWELHTVVTLAVLLLVIGGTLYRSIALARVGGISIALELGGRSIEPNSTDPDERKLLNVVEEMALASGVPTPEVFILEEEGINAFAAGHNINDAVIGVTKGCIQKLSRDELQGVIAHEFSHIFHGDMKLNMRIMGVLFGILLISFIGRILMYSGYSRRSYSFRSSRSKNTGGLALVGLALFVIGYSGLFFGRLIQAGVSRQREFLADASAVQYTRNPDGIAGALKKIASNSNGSDVLNPKAEEVSHFFLAAAMRSKLSGWFATHPPLNQRIKAIDPSFKAERLSHQTTTSSVPLTSQFSSSQSLVSEIGQPRQEHVEHARNLIGAMSGFTKNSAHDPYSARAVVYSIFLSPQSEIQSKQLQHLNETNQKDLIPILLKAQQDIQKIGTTIRLALIDLSLPSLKKLSQKQRAEFLESVQYLILADQKFHMFEYALFKVLLNALDFDQAKSKSRKTADLQKASSTLISALAYAGSEQKERIQDSFSAAKVALGMNQIELLPIEACGPSQINDAIDQLRKIKPGAKQRLISSCLEAISHDGKLEALEAELLRAVGESLEIPIPPLAA